MIRVDRHPQCSGSFACLRSRPSLANRTGPNVEVVVARCRNCSSKLCWKCGQCGIRSLQQEAADQELQRNCNFGTATSYYLLNGFSRGIQVCFGGSLAFLIDDLTFYGRWHIFRVDRHRQCSGSFACLGSRPSLASRTGTTVEVVVASCHNRSSQLCWKCGPRGLRSLQQKAADQEFCLPLAKRFCTEGYEENDKTMTMAPLGFINEDVKTAGSTMDIRVHYTYPDSYHSISKN